MCLDANEEVIYIDEDDLTRTDATMEQERNETRLTESLAAEGVKPAKPSKKETFPIDTA